MKYLKYLIFILVSIFFVPAIALAATPLHDEPPGTVITFSGKQWVILEQKADGTTYILLNSNDGSRVFDPNSTQLFNPLDSNNIGYYLNNTFYNSLPQKDLIETHSWDIKFQNGIGSQANVTANIGLISYAEYMAYSSYYNGNILPSSYEYYWWTRTPCSGYSTFVYYVSTSGSLSGLSALNSRGVRPALYLQSGILVSETKEVIGVGEVDTIPPAIPSGLNGNAVSDTKIQLSWNQNSESDLAGYRVYRNGIKVVQISTNNYEDTGLTDDTTYSYQISSYDTSGNESTKCLAVQVTTEQTNEPPTAPKGLTASEIGPGTVDLTWNENTEPDLTSYNVYRDGVKLGGTAINSYKDAGLIPETSYSYQVTAVDIKGSESEKSAPITVTTLEEILPPPPPPSGLRVGHLTDVTARVEWELVKDAQEYKIYLNGFLVDTTTDEFYEFTGMEPETSYLVTLTSLVGDQESDQAAPIEFTTLASPTDPPAKPYLSIKSYTGMSAAYLSWSLDDPLITKWEVYMDGNLILELPGDADGTKISNLENGTYSFKVRAYNSVGASEYSDTVDVTITSLAEFAPRIADIFSILSMLIRSMWPLLALGLALILIPRLIRILYATLVVRR